MVKALFLGLFAVMMCSLACAAPAHKITQPSNPEASPSPPHPSLEDTAARSERSTNLSHITGTARKIQMFMDKRHLQLLPDGTVNGTSDDSSAYTILQRTTVAIGQLKIQGVATCQYLCMDSCGLLYGSREFGDECVFNEMIEHNHYNTYSSTKYSNKNRTMYLALNRRGQPRKVLIKAGNSLGTHSVFARVLTRTVSPERAAERLHRVRHHNHLCTNSETTRQPQSADPAAEHPRCRKRKKKKKKKRKCSDSDSESDSCQKRQTFTNSRKKANKLNKKCNPEDSEECQRIEVTNKKKIKNSKFGDKSSGNANAKKKKKLNSKVKHKKPRLTVTTEVPTTSTYAVTEELLLDEDYMVDTTTDWDDTTISPEDGTFRPD